LNIFILDKDIQKNVQYYIDKHVVKMILEHVQMLSTVNTHKMVFLVVINLLILTTLALNGLMNQWIIGFICLI